MTTAEFLSHLRGLRVRVWDGGDRLRYNAPPGVMTGTLREEVARRQVEILAALRGFQAATRFAVPPITRRPSGSVEPLSFAQQRLWFLEQLDPGSAVYNLPAAFRILGRLDVEALEASLNEIVRRHEALRTTYVAVGGEPVQVIAPEASIPLPVFDLTGLPESEAEDEARRRAAEEARRPFDLARGPLMRASVVRLGDADHVLLLTMHHIVSDGWSIGVLTRELTAIYRAFSTGSPSVLPELSVQYADFAAWQRQWLRGERLDRQLAYWRRQLEGLGVLQLPTDRPRPPVQSFRGAWKSWSLPDSLTEALKELSQREGVTVFMTLLAAFQTLLHRYSGQSDIVVGSPIANRNRREIEGLIGFFVNSLVMRTDVSGDPDFRQLLSRVKEVALGAFDHQDVPFERLVDELGPGRDLGQSPLFQVVFALQNAPVEALSLEKLTVRRFEFETITTRFDLEVHVGNEQGCLRVAIFYRTDLYDAATIDRMFCHYETLLEGVTRDPGRRLSELPLLKAEEERQMLVCWNATSQERAGNRCVHEAFETQAGRLPEAVAVHSGEVVLTYRELNARSNQLARYLRSLGVGPEVKVAICVERSVEMVVGVLGILKAGGAYLPMDPAYPKWQLGFMLSDANVPVLLTQERLLAALPEHGARVVCLDRDWTRVEEESGESLASAATGGNLAYVIYTSGSTGRPKGVELQHGGLSNLVKWHQRLYDVQPSDRATQLAGPAFDASVWELWPYLTAGASIHVPDDETRLSPARLRGWLAAEGITLSFLPTPLAEGLLKEGGRECLSLRALLTGGDRLHRVSGGSLPFHLVNHYGPTEGTVVATCGAVAVGEDLDPAIGRPIDNTRVYVLDGGMRPVPVGVAGELHIGGDGLARGYLGRPELTAEKFVPDPFSGEPGERLYRTGDLVRYRADGMIEFLGRMDTQVKVRGFRIELGEVETVLGQYPAVRDAAVVVREDEPGDKRLVGYVSVREAATAPTAAELRSHMKGRLPQHMVPAAFVVLKSLPLSPNGKVDRRALPAPDGLVTAGEAYEEPRTPAEEALSGIWSEVLRIPVVGVRDNFFELGGDSILSLQVIARANAAGLRLSLKQLFEHQTVAELARVAGTAPEVEADQGAVVGEVPLTPIQRWFFAREAEDAHHFNHALLLEVRWELAGEVFEKAARELEVHHDALRMRFTRGSSGWQQHCVAPSSDTPFRRVDLSGQPEPEQRKTIDRIAEETQRSLDLGRGPVWRMLLFEAGQGRRPRLLIVIHHLVVDGVSWRVLLEDLQTACQQLSRRERVKLPRKTTSFKRWSERLVAYANDGRVDQELGYWREVAGSNAARLPVDHEGSVSRNTVATERTVSVALAEEETQALLQEVPAAYRTKVGDVLLAALVEAFAPWTGREELVIDLEGHGREDLFERVDPSRTVGWFTTVYPVRLPRVTASAEESLKRVKEHLRRVPNRGIGYGVLRYLRGHEIGSGAEVSFNYLGQFDQVFGETALFRVASDGTGSTRSEHGQRAHLIEVNGSIAGGRLRLDWSYSEAVHDRQTVEGLSSRFADVLRGLIEHCRSGVWGFTPSDFPLASLDQASLDRVVGQHRQVEDIYPLSPMQEGMLFHALLAPGRPVYLEQAKHELEGALDTVALRRAWERVTERHAVLRTRFVWNELEQPLQVVERGVSLPWEEEDWSGLVRKEQTTRFEQLLEADRRRGFEPERAPLMRMKLLRLDVDRHLLLWSFHHVLLDGWSVALLWREVLALYRLYARGVGTEPAETRPYREYVAWLQGQDLGAAERYWREELKGFSAPTALGVDRHPGMVATEVGVRERAFTLSEQATRALKAMGRHHGLTLNTLVQAAWALLLSRYSGERDVLFGVTMSGRPASLRGVETMIGLFINTLPLRVEVSGEQRLLGWLKRLQNRQLEQRQYEYSPLTHVQQWSEVESGRPLFESVLVFENYPVDPSLRDLTEEPRVRSLGITETTNFPLIVVAGGTSILGLRLIYDRRRFDDEAIRRLEGHLTCLLEQMASDPDCRLSELSLLRDGERHQVVVGWNETGRPYPEPSISGVFEEQVRRTPDAEAVVFGVERLSYRELNERANRLARHLRGVGVVAETRVGICCERSVEMIVGLLGILKAGGAYVPLDPSYPKERLGFMLSDSGVRVLLTQRRLVKELPEHRLRVVCLDGDWGEIARQGGDDLGPVAMLESLAYVTYTSGSTGTPKGVEVTQRGVLRLLFGVEYAEFGREQTFLQLAPISFDASTLEIWGALLHGGRCVVFPERVPSAGDLGRVVRDERVTTLWLTASLYNAVIDESPEALSGVKQLLIGGEALSVPHVRRGLERLGGTQIINGYGPTESTTFTCCYRIPRELGEHVGSIPIGRPIGNTRVYVLDEGMRPVPVGVSGELYIGGDGLARGYLGRPELTGERFVPDPFSKGAGERLYRTGDLVRYLADGNVEFLGRIDNQVKVRGYRIELGEIESVLGQHPAVQDAVVMVREDHPGDRRLVAYVTGRTGQVLEADELRSHVQGKLPEYMVPSAFVVLESLPLTANGKVDRRSLPSPAGGPSPEEAFVAPRNEVEERIAAVWRATLHLDSVGIHDNFFDVGGHSLLLLQVHGKLKQIFERKDLSLVELFQFPTIDALARHVSREEREVRSLADVRDLPRNTRRAEEESEAVAIIGMSGRFPGASNVEELWRNLRAGVESIRTFSEDELARLAMGPALLGAPRYVKAAGVVDDIELFDAAFFRYHPREAEGIDPQQRLFLECAWEALETAGCDPERFGGRIGVYAGIGTSGYSSLVAQRGATGGMGGLQAFFGTGGDFLSTRVSYKLNLKGPSLNVQTACSTSLVAVHLACQSLLSGECDVALAGGVSIRVPQKAGYEYQEGGILSPDGHCRAFDARAKGTAVGNGIGIVVLKRLSQALADRDRIEGVIRGSAINNDGASKVGYTAPSVDGQAEVIAAAQAAAGIKPSEIGYVEAHGTATPLGDPIEIAALTQVFRADTDAKGFCAIGSLKTNLGHLDAAAGVAGLIKAVLTVKHGEIPASLHFEKPNPEIDLATSPFYVNTALSEWNGGGKPRIAGVSSFGIGGTNAHVVVEEPPVVEDSGPSRPAQLLIVSAKTESAVAAATAKLADHLRAHPEVTLADVAYTLGVGRAQFEYRRMAVCREVEEACGALSRAEAQRVAGGAGEQRGASVAFLFPGQGSQYVGMGGELYREEAVFREEVDRCAELLAPELGVDLREVLYPEAGEGEAASEHLKQTWLSQPALFVVEYALAKLWMSWGVKPEAMIGHSLGEYVAACVSGVFSVEEALELVTARGRLMQWLPGGAMVAVGLSAEEVRTLLDGDLSLAASNGPALSVVSGVMDAVERLEKELGGRGVEYRRLHTSHAFHSAMVEPILGEFAERVGKVSLKAPRIPYVSNVTGTWIRAEEAMDPGYWARHLRETVRFGEGLGQLLKDSRRVLLEVGPGQTLSSLARQHPGRDAGQLVIGSTRHAQEKGSDEEHLLKAVGRLWLSGVEVDWPSFYGREHRRRVALPTYPFERQRYWIEPVTPASKGAADSLPKKPDIADWFYIPSWTRSLPPISSDADRNQRWLAFEDTCGLGPEVVRQFGLRGRAVIVVRAGERFAQIGERAYALDPRRPEDYQALLRELHARDWVPDRIAHLWGVTNLAGGGSERLETSQDLGFYSLLFLAQALGEELPGLALRVSMVTSDMQHVTGQEALCPEKAMVLGPCKVIPQEYPALTCRSIDIDLPGPRGWTARRVGTLVAELEGRPSEPVVAYRNGIRWVPSFEAVRVDGGALGVGRLRQGGVYLITGGLGGVGLEVAACLARVQAKLVLTTRSPFPPREQWSEWLGAHDVGDPTSRRIRKVRALEELGSEVVVARADVASEPEMRDVVARTVERFGALHGVMHAAGAEKRRRRIAEADRAHCESQFRPKVQGLMVLAKVLEGRPLDLCMVHSSLASVLGVTGFVSYTAAHLFMDAFVSQRNGAEEGTPWTCVNWDNWRTWDAEGQAAAGLVDFMMEPEEGTEALQRVLSLEGATQLVVSTGDLQARIDRWITRSFLADQQPAAELAPAHARPELATPYVAPRTEEERTLAGLWQELLGLERVGIHDNFFELGGDSVMSIQIAARSAEAGLRLSSHEVLERQTIAELASGEKRNRRPRAAEAAGEGVPLTPIQHWFFEQKLADSHHFNQAMLLEVQPGVAPSVLEAAWRGLNERHDALRLHYRNGDGGWQGVYDEAGGRAALTRIDLTGRPEAERQAALEAAAEDLQTSLSLSEGPLVCAAYFDLGAGRPARLLLIIHHLLVDVISWRILLEELDAACRQLGGGQAISLPPPTTSFGQWARAQRDYAKSGAVAREAEYWLSLPWDRVTPLPVDKPGGANSFGSRKHVSASLGVGETRSLLQEVPQRYKTQINDLLLTALARAFQGWSGQSLLLVDLEGHGREAIVDGMDLSRTVGWFTTLFPVLLDLEGAPGPLAGLKRVKEQLRVIPERGIGYGLVRYLGTDEEMGMKLARLPQAEVSFLYLGRFDPPASESGLLRLTTESSGPPRSPRHRRRHLLEISGQISKGQLRMHWSYSENLHRRATIEGLAESFREALRSLIEYAPSVGAEAHTTSDFPGARLEQSELEKVLSSVKRAGSTATR